MTTSDRADWRDPALGTPRELDLRPGRVRCFEAGTGPPLVFVHGLLVNANLWRKVVAKLSNDFHCVALDLPLGSHRLPMNPDADLSAPALADLIADAIEALGLEDVTLVGNDTGGALCQMVVTRRPERIGRLVLTSCDYRDNFPPRLFAYFKPAARLPGAFPLLLGPLRLRAARRLPIAFGWLTNAPIDREAEDSYLYPAMTDGRVRADLRKVIKGLGLRYSNEAADRLPGFGKPALVAWSADDKVFPRRDAERLAADLGARLEWIEGARTFSAEDQPGRLAELIAGFVSEPVGSTLGERGLGPSAEPAA
jgi:pimeloyl-ACP methyl ester carboxylesterase